MPRHPSAGRRRHAVRGIRGRSTAAAVVVVAVALLVGAGAFLLLLQRDLISAAQGSAEAGADDVAVQIRANGLAAVARQIDTTTRTGQLIQVLDPSGQVVAASSPRAARQPLTTARAAPGDIVDVRASRIPLLDEDDPYLIAVAGVSSSGTNYRVVAATPIGAQQRSVQTALSLLLIGMPLLLLLVGVATWVLVGRTLRPVERVRRRVSEIGGTTVGERLRVPDTDDEIARLAVTMNEMLERLDEAHRAQHRFVADASHELRSPLSTLTASVELARTDASAQTWRELAPLIEGEVARMSRLVSDLLLLAKADEMAITLRPEEVDLDDLLETEVRRLRAVADLTVEHDISPVRVVADAGRLGQVITNLGDNAARHARSTVRLTLKSQVTDGVTVAVLRVDDDGDGVPEEHRQRVFERFVRLDDSRDRTRGGSGLGLAIVAELVRAQGGTVGIATSPLGGCRVELRLPQMSADPT
jgi:signal transduction histidine kinase